MTLKSVLRKFGLIEKQAVPDQVWYPFGFSTNRGVQYENAYQLVGWVYRCVRAISTNIQQVPVRAVRRTQGKNGEYKFTRLPDAHPLARLLEKPNETDDFKALLEGLATHLNLRGEGIWELETNPSNPNGTPFAIKQYAPQWIMRANIHNDNYKDFELYVNGSKIVVDGTNACFFKYYNPQNPWRGLAPLQAAFQAAETDYDAQRFNSRFFQNAPNPAVIIKNSGENRKNLTADERERLRAEITRLHAGVDKAAGVLVLGPGQEIDTVALQMKDMSFAQLRKFDRAEIQAVFGVPPILAGEVDNANRANSGEQRLMFWQETLLPLVEDISSMCNRKIASRFGDDTHILFDTLSLPALQPNRKEVMDWILPAIDGGVITINEARHEYLGKPPVEWGDTWWNAGLTSIQDEEDAPPSKDGGDAKTPKVSPDNPGEESITPAVAKALLNEWKNAILNRVRSGMNSPVAAFPCAREARKAARKFHISRSVAWELARAVFSELALDWDIEKPERGISEMFEQHAARLSKEDGGKEKQ